MSTKTSKPLRIDGSTGEGGGQIIRTALTLSMITGTPIQIDKIRAGRKKSGLMRQHLMCVTASQQISDASVQGATLGSTSLSFAPQTVQAGDYHFDIGSAGSTSLVLQTILPALLFANAGNTRSGNVAGLAAMANRAGMGEARLSPVTPNTTLTIKGGTHNPLAPTTDFLQLAFVPMLARLGMQVDIRLEQAGFAPVGGGEIKATISPFMRLATHSSNNASHAKPLSLQSALSLTKRGDLLGIELVAGHLNLDYDICQRELASAKASLLAAGVDESLITTIGHKLQGIGEGTMCYGVVKTAVSHDGHVETHQEVFTVLGERRMSAEKVGGRLAGLIKRYLHKSDALFDEYLTDQLLLPLALAGGGEFTARMISEHTETQAWLIEQFLPVNIKFEQLDKHKTLVKVIC